MAASGIARRPGQRCEQAGCCGMLRVYTTRVNFILKIRTRYLSCDKCGHCPTSNKWVVPLEYAPPHTNRSTA